MSLIHNITWINQNVNVASLVASESVAREIISKEFQKIINKEKERKVDEVKEVEHIEEILPDEDSKRQIQKEAQRHIDIKA